VAYQWFITGLSVAYLGLSSKEINRVKQGSKQDRRVKNAEKEGKLQLFKIFYVLISQPTFISLDLAELGEIQNSTCMVMYKRRQRDSKMQNRFW